MNTNKKSIKDPMLQMTVKKMLEKAKSMNLIKSHTEAFKTTPVEKEAHKGSKKYFAN